MKTYKRLFTISLLTAISVFLFLFCGDDGGSGDACPEERWVGVWAAAASDGSAKFSDQSLRLMLSPTRGGETARVRLSNRFGEEAIDIANPHLGRQLSGADLVHGSNAPLYFDGQPKVTIPAGAEVVSDPVEFAFEAFETLAVSLHIPSPGGWVTQHAQAAQTSYATEPGGGDQSGETGGQPYVRTMGSRPLVMGLDALAPGSTGVVVAIGDSITDGAGSRLNADERYPDHLARAAIQQGRDLSVLNLGIGGNRILSDGILATFGVSLLNRLEKDVLSRDDVTDVIILEGINDLAILPSATAEEVIEGLKQAVAMLKAGSEDRPPLNVLVGTLTPTGNARDSLGPLFLEAGPQRAHVNEFIRTGDVADGIVDFDAAVRDPEIPTQLVGEYDSGDGVHPSSAGYERMAGAVDFSQIKGPDCSY